MQDHSGRVFKRKGTAAVTLKDVQANREASSCDICAFFWGGMMFFLNNSLLQRTCSKVVCAVLNASKGRGYFSKRLMTDAVKIFYQKYNLYPAGLGDNLPAVAEWAEKNGEAVARLVFWLH